MTKLRTRVFGNMWLSPDNWIRVKELSDGSWQLPTGEIVEEKDLNLVADDMLSREIQKLNIKFRASGHKSSEGDGRTAADIKKEQDNAAKQQR